MSATVHQFPKAGPEVVTKKRLAEILGVTERWVEKLARQGMPVGELRRGKRTYNVAQVKAWLAEREERKDQSDRERIADLESRMATVERALRDGRIFARSS